MRNKGSVIIDDNPAAFLSPVLQSIEACADSPADVGRLLCEHAENAALFMNTHPETSMIRSGWYSPSAIHPLSWHIQGLP